MVLLAGVLLARSVAGRLAGPDPGRLAHLAERWSSSPTPCCGATADIQRNPTSLPHNYTTNLTVVVVAVVCGTAAVALIRTRRRRDVE